MDDQNGQHLSITAGVATENDGIPGSAQPSAGDAIDPTQFVRKGRGRHPNDCPCERCESKRSGGQSTSQASGGSTRKGGAKSNALDLTVFATQIVGVHKLIAIVTKNEVFIIKDEEAKSLAQALKNVMALHSINVSPATMAYAQLFAVCAAIYGPRLMILKLQAQVKAAQKKEENLNTGPVSNAPTTGVVFPTPTATQ